MHIRSLRCIVLFQGVKDGEFFVAAIPEYLHLFLERDGSLSKRTRRHDGILVCSGAYYLERGGGAIAGENVRVRGKLGAGIWCGDVEYITAGRTSA